MIGALVKAFRRYEHTVPYCDANNRYHRSRKRTFMERLLLTVTDGLPMRIIGDYPVPRSVDSSHPFKPYMERYSIFELFGWNIYLHRFLRGDPDRSVHDHPFDGFSFILTEGYTEEVPIQYKDGTYAIDRDGLILDRKKRRWFNWVPSKKFHVVRMNPGSRPIWTLFIHGPRKKSWGFLQVDKDETVYVETYPGSEDLHRRDNWRKSEPTGRTYNDDAGYGGYNARDCF